jgi:molybdenum cofactor cytidylyltransferase
MGSPKALLRYREETFIGRLCRLFLERCSPVIVVLGAGAEEIRPHVPGGARAVINAAWRTGQTGSMQCGLRAVPAEAEAVLFTLVDHPAVEASTIDALLRARGAELLRVPRFAGKRGHPIWFSRELIPEFLALPPDGAARDVVRGHAAQTGFLDLDDPGIAADIDDPQSYRSLVCADS